MCPHVTTPHTHTHTHSHTHTHVHAHARVQVALTLALSVNDFYDTRELFITNLAYVLKIEPSRLRIVSVVPGSAQVCNCTVW